MDSSDNGRVKFTDGLIETGSNDNNVNNIGFYGKELGETGKPDKFCGLVFENSSRTWSLFDDSTSIK